MWKVPVLCIKKEGEKVLDRYVAVDLEMTGLDPVNDKILEIGACRFENGKITDVYQSLVDPETDIDQVVVDITGITYDMVRDAKKINEVLVEFYEFLGNDVIAAHNISIDYAFLKQKSAENKIKFSAKGVDTLAIARKLLPKEEKKTLENLCKIYGIRRENAHRAFDDAKATGELLQIFMQGQEQDIRPVDIAYKVKKKSPATARQKNYLNQLIEYHKIRLAVDFDSLTRSEASRLTDKLISEHGRLKP